MVLKNHAQDQYKIQKKMVVLVLIMMKMIMLKMMMWMLMLLLLLLWNQKGWLDELMTIGVKKRVDRMKRKNKGSSQKRGSHRISLDEETTRTKTVVLDRPC